VDGPSPRAAAWIACHCESVSTRSGCRAPWYASVRPRCSSPPLSYFSPYRMEYSEFEVPRARGPTTTPAEPLDSTLTPPRVPDMWPTPALVTPTVKPDRKFRRNPAGPFAAPVKENVVKSLRLGGLPLMTFVRALMNPEQSKPPGPTPPHTYGLPACARAYRSARCTGGPPTPESMLLVIHLRTLSLIHAGVAATTSRKTPDPGTGPPRTLSSRPLALLATLPMLKSRTPLTNRPMSPPNAKFPANRGTTPPRANASPSPPIASGPDSHLRTPSTPLRRATSLALTTKPLPTALVNSGRKMLSPGLTAAMRESTPGR